jgi:hypothetical protein
MSNVLRVDSGPITIYCIGDPSDFPYGYIVQSAWRPTVYPTSISCYFADHVILVSGVEYREERPV